MMLAIQDKFRNQDFLDHIEQWASEIINDEQWANFRDDSNTTSLWDFFNNKIKESALLFFSKASTPSNPNKELKTQKSSLFEEINIDTEKLVNSVLLCDASRIKQVFRLWMHSTNKDKINKKLKNINESIRQMRKNKLQQDIFWAWQNKDSAHMWAACKQLAGKKAMRSKPLIRLAADEWAEGLTRQGKSGGLASTPISNWSTWAGLCSNSPFSDTVQPHTDPQPIPTNHRLAESLTSKPITFVSGGLLVEQDEGVSTLAQNIDMCSESESDQSDCSSWGSWFSKHSKHENTNTFETHFLESYMPNIGNGSAAPSLLSSSDVQDDISEYNDNTNDDDDGKWHETFSTQQQSECDPTIVGKCDSPIPSSRMSTDHCVLSPTQPVLHACNSPFGHTAQDADKFVSPIHPSGHTAFISHESVYIGVPQPTMVSGLGGHTIEGEQTKLNELASHLVGSARTWDGSQQVESDSLTSTGTDQNVFQPMQHVLYPSHMSSSLQNVMPLQHVSHALQLSPAMQVPSSHSSSMHFSACVNTNNSDNPTNTSDTNPISANQHTNLFLPESSHVPMDFSPTQPNILTSESLDEQEALCLTSCPCPNSHISPVSDPKSHPAQSEDAKQEDLQHVTHAYEHHNDSSSKTNKLQTNDHDQLNKSNYSLNPSLFQFATKTTCSNDDQAEDSAKQTCGFLDNDMNASSSRLESLNMSQEPLPAPAPVPRLPRHPRPGPYEPFVRRVWPPPRPTRQCQCVSYYPRDAEIPERAFKCIRPATNGRRYCEHCNVPIPTVRKGLDFLGCRCACISCDPDPSDLETSSADSLSSHSYRNRAPTPERRTPTPERVNPFPGRKPSYKGAAAMCTHSSSSSRHASDVSEVVCHPCSPLFENATMTEPAQDRYFDNCGNELFTCNHALPWGKCFDPECMSLMKNKLLVQNVELEDKYWENKNACVPTQEPTPLGSADHTDPSIFSPRNYDYSPEKFLHSPDGNLCNSDLATRRLVLEDIRGITKHVRKSKCRKAGPKWAAPNEIWRLLLCVPVSFDQPRAGIGSAKYYYSLEAFRQMLRQILLKIRMTESTPYSWHRSRVFSLYKKSPTLVDVPFDSQRSIHSLDSFGKAFYRHLWNKSNLQSPLDCEFGYVRSRRREYATKTQLMNQQRLMCSNLSHIAVSHDMTNAFASTNFQQLDANIEHDARSCDQQVLKHRYRMASIHIEHDEPNKVADFTIGSGSLPGDNIASDLFSRCFRKPVSKWTEDCKQPFLTTTCPLRGCSADTSKTMYADDLFNIIVVQGLDTNQMQEIVQASNTNLTEQITPIGVGQNTKKQEITVACFGANSRNIERDIRKNKLGGKNILHQLKYLGSWISESGSITKEINARLEVAWKKWFMFSKLLTDSDIPFTVRRLCFINMVYNTLLSGLEAFVLSNSELDKLTKFICSRCRALLLGKAHSKIDQNTHTSLSNHIVVKKTGILPVHLELTVRRLKWFKQIVTRPSSAGNLIAAWFGNFEIEVLFPGMSNSMKT
jgi:hypothetical protein